MNPPSEELDAEDVFPGIESKMNEIASIESHAIEKETNDDLSLKRITSKMSEIKRKFQSKSEFDSPECLSPESINKKSKISSIQSAMTLNLTKHRPHQSSFLISQHSNGSRKSQVSSQFLNIFKRSVRIRSEQNLLTNQKPLKNSHFYNVISSFYLCRKFIYTLMKLTAFRKPKWLTSYHFKIMNDKAFSYNQYKKDLRAENTHLFDSERLSQAKIQSMMMEASVIHKSLYSFFSYIIPKNRLESLCWWFNKISKFLENKQIFQRFTKIYDPTKSFTILWDFIMMIMILFYFIIIPLELTFSLKNYISPIEITKKFALNFFVLDILKTFNTTYYHKGILVINRKEIFIKYIYHNFPLDILSILPLCINYYLSNYGNSDFLNMFFFIKYSHFRRILQRFEELIFLDQNIVALIKLVFRILFFSHIFACFWFYIGTFSEDSWLKKANLLQSHWTHQYLVSFYFIIVTMNTVGFGDITPVSSNEIVFIILLILIGCGLFAVNINSIGIILSNISRRASDCSKELNIINQFMLEKDINFELRMRIRKYLQYIWNEEKLEEIEHQTHVINKLSDSLKDELLLEANGPYIRDIKLLNLNFTEETLRQTVNIMKETRYTPGDMIFLQNDVDNKNLYIIRKGQIELFMENHPGISMKKLEPGDIFGELGFFSNKERSTCARSLDFTNVFVISQQDFLAIIQKNKKDIERFCQIRDSINIYDDYGDLFTRCFSCQDSGHQMKDCPLLHYIPKREIVLLKYLYTQKQERKEFYRKWKKDINAFKGLTKIECGAFKFQSYLFPSHESLSEKDEYGIEESKEITENSMKLSKKLEKQQNLDKKQNLFQKTENFQKNSKKEVVFKKNDFSISSIKACKELPLEIPESSHNKLISLRNLDDYKSLETFKILQEIKEKDDETEENSEYNIKNKYMRRSYKEKSYHQPISQSLQEINLSKNQDLDEFSMKSIDFSAFSMKNHSLTMPIIPSKKTIYVNKNSKNEENMKEFRKDAENIKYNIDLELERVKSFEVYFPENNIERVLARIEYLKLTEMVRKGKKNNNHTKKKYQLFLENNMHINERKPDFLIGSVLAFKLVRFYEIYIKLIKNS